MLFSNYALGAGVATDLVNTSAAVRVSTGEALHDPAALARFLDEHGLHLGAGFRGGRPTDEDLTQVHALRRETRALLEAATEDEVADGANRLVRRAATGPALLRDADGRWQWHITTMPRSSVADELAVVVGAGLLGVLHTLSHDRFRHCASPVCGGMFVDTSKAGRRRYCMPGLCGNRLNVANHRARQQRSGEAPAAGRRTRDH
ncbi:CGNR zinc finger domain-containing protein [Streptomyces enissocaesilis]|uniref:CGNR zinc finger domain-containing protein n=1 Tax=Streptomyces enissocaesilis TaxID=332589 RepID=A0ABP6JM92_9ACTN